jgi:uncharacterized iron-regulated protein
VFLGEKHDNPDHHRLEAAALADVAEDRPAAMVLEMIPTDKQAALDQLFATKKNDVHAADIGLAVEWDKSGWPAFTQYQPLFEVAVGSRVAIVGGDLSRSDAHAITHGGADAIRPELATDFHLSTPLPPDVEAAFEKEIADVHCGMLPPAFVPKMVLAQRARDATLAKAVLDEGALQTANAPKYASVVLVSGAGHARTDRGAPKLLQERGVPASQMISVGMLEVDDERPKPEDYASGFHAAKLPFDLVWFTPRANDDDPCAQMKAPAPAK